MIRVSNLSLPVDSGIEELRRITAKTLHSSPGELGELVLARRSIDARKKRDIRYVYTVEVSMEGETALVERLRNPSVTLSDPKPYVFPGVRRISKTRPVVVGMGPAGLFAAYLLAQNGLPPVILERGRPVEMRTVDVEHYWETGVLDTGSNVQFGEGGAGAFSDGKLTTGTHDPRLRVVLRALAALGAPEDILYSAKPHIGTDVLREVLKKFRGALLALGCDIRFGHQLTGLIQKNRALEGIKVTSLGASYTLPCDALVLAPGHSARDTFAMLYEAGVPMEQKPFAIGVRIEHPQVLISQAQYGPLWEKLPPADYKLACHLPNGRSAFTFCVCPGGQVVAAASGEGQVVTNGMSCRARDGANINGGFLVNVGPGDFGGSDPLAGMRFQEHWEHTAFLLGGSNGQAPAQAVGDFLAGRAGTPTAGNWPTYRPGVTWTDLTQCLPDYVSDTLRGALPRFERKLHGFADGGAVLTGIESRSSSPVRILRGEDHQSALKGLYPCGEGAGYAGGIMSAAVDGIRVAEAVAAHP